MPRAPGSPAVGSASASVEVRGQRATAASTLWLHLHLPYLPLEVLTRGVDSGEACVLAAGEGRRRRILLSNRHAAALGVRAGMPLGAAHALGQLRVLERNEAAERRALDRLCLWAMHLTPMVAQLAPDGLVLEIRGSLKLFAGLDNLLMRLRRGLKQLGYRVDYAVAPTPLAAGLLARSKTRSVVLDRQQLHSAVAALPIEALRLEAEQSAALAGLGVRRVGECRRLPRDGLARRLSPALLDTLDRLFGQVPDPRAAFAVPRSFVAELALPWEVDNARGLLTAGERLVHELSGYLTANAATTRHLRWRLTKRDGQVEYFDIRLSRASRDTRHMLLLLRETLTRKKLDRPVCAIGLNVSDVIFGAAPGSRDLFAQDNHEGDGGVSYAAFIDRLRSRCGEQALRSLGINATHNPERAWCWQRPLEGARYKSHGLSHVELKPVQRPLWLLKQAVKLTTRNGQPLFGGPLSLIPDRERIVHGWWNDAEVARDYFTARTSGGGRLWIYRQLDGERCWYLHGIFE